MAYYDKNFLTFVGNVANKQITLYQTSKGVPFAFVTLINHVVFDQNHQNETVVECVAWRQRAVNLTQYHSGDKLEIKARLSNGVPITDQNGYQQTTVVPTIISAHRHVYLKNKAHAQGNYPNNRANYPNNRPNNNQNRNRQQQADPFTTKPNGSQNKNPFPSSPFANKGATHTDPFANQGQSKPKGQNKPQGKAKPSTKRKPANKKKTATGKRKATKTK